jgi:hypothetical protein
MTEFQRQLKDPRWQKRRLAIMDRDEWTCKGCGDIEATLTVHHKSYRMEGGKFADIWDYPDSDLITLCEHCHNGEEIRLETLKQNFYFQVRDLFENSETFTGLLILLRQIRETKGERIDMHDFAKLYTIVEGE